MKKVTNFNYYQQYFKVPSTILTQNHGDKTKLLIKLQPIRLTMNKHSLAKMDLIDSPRNK